MANTSSAKKALRGAAKRHVFNTRRKKEVKDAFKEVTKLLQEKSADKALKVLPALQKALDKATKQGVIKANAAARIKSRITKRIRAIAG